ncbi:cytochrome ubiquinol oxidase subunit I [Gimesia maris]|jgi:cytochrome d ubiquinol oxidase subunit I|uniref:Cytochrome bd ubiquinol oxidase subunit 1 n=3 Tax=Gimesia maris TaxID=122 RepID=A0ABX5YTY2_9PLAN|nr:cytochrome ubiquinol oxidase subunit I [Gimesia maris]MAC54868.1 cytochrome ubiquinol oxidase subunit I [Gimesia sp.]EDL58789.1 cytochrome bd ubiquinol oxidase, subunit I [Gimesia maris DSM 8797]QDT81356.1 Cytochrome bd ubiquinol oxidase subunit 1 [Gimesia maris]QDU17082.1 Cytochrome bd ubiquinol oxidase subunit 1 [Gimesia maris]QEG19138.1 Cytochrome bd ubiquinol oxidase subunit 1 [Gimesia maris]|tara:strand:+ start:34082 stop:35434 length:1353 start_codon:yes stop_codon:yes gene_type:complete
MIDSLLLHRVQFAFTASFHYLFPQLTMGLALLIFILKCIGLRGNPWADAAARFWLKIFGLTFLMGVVTGIPLEFQFGTNWAQLVKSTGSILGQTLAMEGIFAFFLESTFLYLLIFGEKKLGKRLHCLVSFLLFAGTWLSGYFIICTNAFLQHPVGYRIGEDGIYQLTSIWALLSNPWAIKQYLHTMTGAVITGCFTMASIAAFHLLKQQHQDISRRYLSVAVLVGFPASMIAAMPTGDWEAKQVQQHQPVKFAAMEGHFHTEDGAGLVILGQPNLQEMKIDNPIIIPKALSFLTHASWNARVKGLTEYDRDLWPDNIELLYFSYHIMAGLGTLFIALMGISLVLVLKRKLHTSRFILWLLMLSLPFPFIANTAGWFTTEIGRQPWLIYNLMKTADGASNNISQGNVMFTLLGFMGLYLLLSVLYFFLVTRIIGKGPELINQPETETEGVA